ncbi:MAG TPA: site-specific DNA-methyltransferase [Candidatus Olsenella pullistercoris]|uniref:Site-specific DNA-methyltransferase n=1 Tax=Candidatus Olsenella pullistercoris TaxID=2838712 RepID=A0A9D2JEB5_9ACTN|nr:site-specific DNA-methyltransferase [Candidatus Olsenella pullistercoris]
MEKLSHTTESIIDENVERLAELFPEVVTEVREPDGTLRHAIDGDALRERVGDVAEGQRERYQFTWPGKREAKQEAYRQIDKCLRPCPEESVNWDTTQNLYIEGDNLDALKLLRNTYAGKVKMIYIDPPYNTGHDFIYDDDFAQTKADYDAESGDYDEEGGRLVANPESNGRFHSDWCSMMYPRLLLARDLLRDDGFILISIGEEELANLMTICKSIFGNNAIRNLLASRRYDKNLNQQFASQGLRSLNVGLEYICVIAKSPHSLLSAVYRKLDASRANEGYWKGFWNAADRPTMRYEILGFTPDEGQWKWKKEIAEEAIENYQIYLDTYQKKMTLEEYWKFSGRSKRFIRRRKGLSGKNGGVEHWVAPSDRVLRTSNWADLLVSKSVSDLPFDSPKNPQLISESIKMAGADDGIVLDFFSGSATTAHAVMQLNAEDGGNRKFIMVQLPEVCDEKSEAAKAGYKNICEIGKERVRRAGRKIASEVEESNRQLKLGEEPKRVPDVGFRVLKIDSSNFEDVSAEPAEYTQQMLVGMADNLKPGRTADDLIIQVMLKKQIELSAPIEKLDVDGCTVFSVDGGRLVACFDRDVSVEVMTAMAKMEPDYAVMRDASFAGDDAVSNFAEIFKNYSSITEVEVI